MVTKTEKRSVKAGTEPTRPSQEAMQTASEIHTLAQMLCGQLAPRSPWAAGIPPTPGLGSVWGYGAPLTPHPWAPGPGMPGWMAPRSYFPAYPMDLYGRFLR